MMNSHSNPPTHQDLATAPRRGRLLEYSLGAAAVATSAVVLAPQEAGAAIVPFSASGSFVEGTVNDGDQSTITIPLPDGTNLLLDQGNGQYVLDFQVPGGLWDNSGAVGSYKTYPVVSVLGPGAAINPTGGFDHNDWGMAVYDGTPYGAWTSAFTDQYIGFETSLGHKGYLQVSWDPATGLFSYNNGALETSGADLTTPGAVPEPGTLALLCAGAVAAARYRRRMLSAPAA
ncbi:MAG: PEP-CTERM sorting domain-containing protein [Candidatus Competibacteraceae bacterium]